MKSVISRGQMQLLIFTFPFGLYLLFGVGADVMQDAWISSVLAVAICLPLVYLYGKLMSLYPGMNIFQVIDKVFGKVFGKILTSVIILHFLFLAGSILHNLIDFIKLTALWDTPRVIPMICIVILVVWILKNGVEVLANWTRLNTIIIFLVLIGLVLMVAPKMDINNLRPLYSHETSEIFKSGLRISMLGFAEVFVYLGFFDCVEPKRLSTIFIKPIIYSGIICTVIVIVNLLLLGGEGYNSFYYPGYESVKRLYFIGEYQRLEAIISVCFTVFRFLELSFCILAASKGFQNLFGLSDYKVILAPTGFLALNIAYVLYGSIMESSEFLNEYWTMYGLILQVTLPIFIFICAYIRIKVDRSSSKITT